MNKNVIKWLLVLGCLGVGLLCGRGLCPDNPMLGVAVLATWNLVAVNFLLDI